MPPACRPCTASLRPHISGQTPPQAQSPAALTPIPEPGDFSGSWVLNEDQSDLGKMGAAFAPARLDVVQHGKRPDDRTTRIIEFGEDQVAEDKLTLDGTESKSRLDELAARHHRKIVSGYPTIEIDSTCFHCPGAARLEVDHEGHLEMTGRGDVPSIQRFTSSPFAQAEPTLVFDRR